MIQITFYAKLRKLPLRHSFGTLYKLLRHFASNVHNAGVHRFN